MKKKISIGLLLLVLGALGVGAYMMHNMMERGFSTRTEPMQLEKHWPPRFAGKLFQAARPTGESGAWQRTISLSCSRLSNRQNWLQISSVNCTKGPL
jgi:hypothetical protein